MKTRTDLAEGFVLVGGRSRRMGRDKALLDFRGKQLFQQTADLLRPFVRSVTLLGSPETYSGLGLSVLADEVPGVGPLGGLYTGLRYSSCEWNVFVACDLPFLDRSVMERLLARAASTRAQAVVPIAGDRRHPLCAVYHRSSLESIRRTMDQSGSHSMQDFLKRLRVEYLVPGPQEEVCRWEGFFFNMNTSEQWQQVQKEAAAIGE